MAFNDWLNKIKNAAGSQGKEKISPSFSIKKELSDYQTKIAGEKSRIGDSFISPAGALTAAARADNKSGREKIIPEPKIVKAPAFNAGIIKTNLIKGEIITFFDWQKAWYQMVVYAVVALLLLAGLYAALLLYEKVKINQVTALAEQVAFKGAKIVAMKTEISAIGANNQRLNVAEGLIDHHIYWTNFFRFLEENTLSTVKYDGFNGDVGGKYNLKAHTKDFINLAEQINVWRVNNWVKDVSTSGGQYAAPTLTETEEKLPVTFSLDLSINPNLFSNYSSRD